MKKWRVWAQFYEYAKDGYMIHLSDATEEDISFYTEGGYIPLGETDLPIPDMSAITDAAVVAIDKDIEEQKLKIHMLEEKKKQLLCIEHKGE